MSRRPPKKRLDYMAQADVLFSKFIRTRDEFCWNCQGNAYLQCGHLISRSYRSIRTNPDNAVALCRRCHVYFTHRPLEWREQVERWFPGRWDELKTQALRYERVDWRAEVRKLKESVGSVVEGEK